MERRVKMKTNKFFMSICLGLFLASCDKTDSISVTPISIKEINEIGELISAEYYGEVIQSLSEIYTGTNLETLERDYNMIRNEYLRLAKNLKPQKIGRKKRLFFRSDIKKVKEQEYVLFKSIWEIGQSKSAHRFFLDAISKLTWQKFKDLYNSRIETFLRDVARKDLKKAELVYLGRGWVKVGYDLTKIDTAMFARNGDTLFLRNFNPIIVAADINPWYIPNNDISESKYYGFQIVYETMSKRISFDQVTTVKAACKNKLIKDAFDRDIYQKAKVNAEESLFNLFKLMHLYEYFEYNHLKIIHENYFELENEILYDNKVDSLETIKINTLYRDQSTPDNSIEYPSYWYENFEEQKNDLDRFLKKINKQTKNRFNHSSWDEFWTDTYLKNTAS